MQANHTRRAGAALARTPAHGRDDDGPGIMAAPEDGLTDGDGERVCASPHPGPGAWYILAARRINPRSAATPVSAP